MSKEIFCPVCESSLLENIEEELEYYCLACDRIHSGKYLINKIQDLQEKKEKDNENLFVNNTT